jgi:hypothetical protein
VLTQAAVFGREHQLDVERTEKVEVEELGGAAGAVEEGAGDATRAQRFRQRRKRRQPDAAGNHPRGGRAVDDRERPPQRSSVGTTSPGSASYNRRVDVPIRLLRMLTAVGVPSRWRSSSNTEKGRRNNGSAARPALIMTN